MAAFGGGNDDGGHHCDLGALMRSGSLMMRSVDGSAAVVGIDDDGAEVGREVVGLVCKAIGEKGHGPDEGGIRVEGGGAVGSEFDGGHSGLKRGGERIASRVKRAFVGDDAGEDGEAGEDDSAFEALDLAEFDVAFLAGVVADNLPGLVLGFRGGE